VLRALLWRFHGADGGGRCFPSYEKIAAAARCARSTVAVAIRELEESGLLTWVNRITRVRVRERDLFGCLITVWQVIRTSNAYRFVDPLELQPGRSGCKSENRTEPQNQDFKTRAWTARESCKRSLPRHRQCRRNGRKLLSNESTAAQLRRSARRQSTRRCACSWTPSRATRLYGRFTSANSRRGCRRSEISDGFSDALDMC
jgi:hypothetical protein